MAEPCAALEDAAARVSGEICPAASDALLDDYRAVLGADPLGRDANLTTRQQWRDPNPYATLLRSVCDLLDSSTALSGRLDGYVPLTAGDHNRPPLCAKHKRQRASRRTKRA